MFQPWPSLDYSRRSGFSYERWLEDRSHAEVVVKALDRGMLERSEQLGDLLQSIDSLTQDQRAGFEQISSDLGGINDTLNWGFVELTDGLNRIEQATHEVRDSIDRVDRSVNDLISAVKSGFRSVISGLDIANDHLATIESATTDVDQAWAISHYKRAIKALEFGYIEDVVELLESIINGDSGRLAFKFDFRFYLILGACYSGEMQSNEKFTIDMEKAAEYYAKAAKYIKMSDGIDAKSVKLCLNSCGWAYYRIGDIDLSEDYFAKSIGFGAEFDAGFGLAKSILSKNEFDRARDIIKYLIARHRDFALARMAGDPDFIYYRQGIFDIRDEVLDEVRVVNSKDRNFDEFRVSFDAMYNAINESPGTRSDLLKRNVQYLNDNFKEILFGVDIEKFIRDDGSIIQSYILEMRKSVHSLRDEALSEKYKSWNDEVYNKTCEDIILTIDTFIARWADLLQIPDNYRLLPDSHKTISSDVTRLYGKPY